MAWPQIWLGFFSQPREAASVGGLSCQRAGPKPAMGVAWFTFSQHDSW